MHEECRYPESYYQINTPAITTKGKIPTPLNHRLLAVLVCLYRIEAGAWFFKHLPWLKTIMHPAVVGAIPGLEAIDVA